MRIDLQNSAQRELPNFHKVHTQRKGGNPSATSGKTHPWAAAPENSRNPDGHSINGLEIHKWLESVILGLCFSLLGFSEALRLYRHC